MSDLISRSELLKMLHYNKAIHGGCEDDETKLIAIDIDKVIEYVEQMPTAFDIEEVVEQLEEEREYSYANFEEYVCDKSFGSDVECDDFFHKGLERAIEIVKRGGIDG